MQSSTGQFLTKNHAPARPSTSNLYYLYSSELIVGEIIMANKKAYLAMLAMAMLGSGGMMLGDMGLSKREPSEEELAEYKRKREEYKAKMKLRKGLKLFLYPEHDIEVYAINQENADRKYLRFVKSMEDKDNGK
jgi:hypothetical protein